MAGGPLFPFSIFPKTADKIFDNVHKTDHATQDARTVGLGVMASLDADAVWMLTFELPAAIPTGTCKLRLRRIANATTGDARVNVKWRLVAVGEDIHGTALSAEGVATYSWATGDDNELMEEKITLDASETIGAGDEGKWLTMDLTFETASWDLAQISTWVPSIIWE